MISVICPKCHNFIGLHKDNVNYDQAKNQVVAVHCSVCNHVIPWSLATIAAILSLKCPRCHATTQKIHESFLTLSQEDQRVSLTVRCPDEHCGNVIKKLIYSQPYTHPDTETKTERILLSPVST